MPLVRTATYGAPFARRRKNRSLCLTSPAFAVSVIVRNGRTAQKTTRLRRSRSSVRRWWNVQRNVRENFYTR